MIGWKPCHVDCGCLDEDACLKAPKNQLEVRQAVICRFCRDLPRLQSCPRCGSLNGTR